METRTDLTEHPIAALLPDMTDEEYAALRADIDAHGLLVPITLYDGQVLDGRHRLRACRELGIEPRYEDFAGDDPLTFVVATNVHRRHLSAAQRAALAVEILPMIEEAARRRQAEAGGGRGRAGGDTRTLSAKMRTPFDRSDKAAAAMTGAGSRYVSDAKRIAQRAPDVLAAVKTGRLDMATAKAAADLPGEVRADLVTRLDTTTPAARKEARAEIARASRITSRPATANVSVPAERCDIHLGSVLDALSLPPCSVDWVVTDPPYIAESLDAWRDLGKVASHVLRPGGALVAMSGQYHLPEVTSLLGENLDYLWTIAYLTPGGTATHVFPRKVNSSWKPVLVYGRQGERYGGPAYGDVARSPVNGADKAHHHWGQSESGMSDLMRRFVEPGQVVLDPFLGGGTTAVVALALGARVLGFDIDPAAIEITRQRIAEVI